MIEVFIKEYGIKEVCKSKSLLYGLISKNMKVNNKIFKNMAMGNTSGAPQMVIKLAPISILANGKKGDHIIKEHSLIRTKNELT